MIFVRSATAVSMRRLFSFALPTPMLTTIFSRRGMDMTFVYPCSLMNAGMISFLYFSARRGSALAVFDSAVIGPPL